MESYTKIDDGRIKISTTANDNGVEITNERIESKDEIEKALDDAEQALNQAQGRVDEVSNLVETINAKLAVFDQQNGEMLTREQALTRMSGN